MAQHLYRIQPTRPAMLVEGLTPEEDAIIEQHFAYLKDLTAQGIVILAGRTLTTDPNGLGIVIFRAADDNAAHALMSNDPSVQQGVMHAELYPFRIALWSPPEGR
jgi:uncharacterized protein YciI